jgi:hypothetical protein
MKTFTTGIEFGTYVSTCEKFMLKTEGTRYGLYRVLGCGRLVLITRCADVNVLLSIADRCE